MSRTEKKKGPRTKYTVSQYRNCSCFFLPHSSPRRPAKHQTDQGAAADPLHVLVYAGAKSRQVCAGREHQHVGIPDGDDPTLAAAAEQRPDYQGKQERPASS